MISFPAFSCLSLIHSLLWFCVVADLLLAALLIARAEQLARPAAFQQFCPGYKQFPRENELVKSNGRDLK